jgi:hypothetical protein
VSTQSLAGEYRDLLQQYGKLETSLRSLADPEDLAESGVELKHLYAEAARRFDGELLETDDEERFFSVVNGIVEEQYQPEDVTVWYSAVEDVRRRLEERAEELFPERDQKW